MSVFSHSDTCPICRSGTTFIAIAGPFLALLEAGRGEVLLCVAFSIVTLAAWVEWGVRHRNDGKSADNFVMAGYVLAGLLMLINEWFQSR